MIDSSVSSFASLLTTSFRALPVMFGALLASTALSYGIASSPPHEEIGDAGDLPATAQGTPEGVLFGISGSFALPGDRDMYAITITDPSIFSARAKLGPFTRMSLLDAAGIGIFSEEGFGGRLLATLPPGDPALTSLTPGSYLLAISDHTPEITSLDRLLFASAFMPPPVDLATEKQASDWTPILKPANPEPTYPYRIILTGAAGAVGGASPIPEPTTALFGLALAGTILSSRRRKAKA